MGRHSLPDGLEPDATGARTGSRRRTVVISTALVLAVAAGSVVALRSGLLPFSGPCGGDSVPLAVVASPDIAPAVEAMADKARKNATRTDGKCLDVKVTSRVSYEVADSLGQRPAQSEFQVWIPDSSLWVDRVGAERGTPLTAAGTIASSPIGLGAVPGAAKALDRSDRDFSWSELSGTAGSGDGLRLGMADPAHSATGLLALARISASNAKRAKDGDEANIRTAAAAKLLYQRAADSDGQVLATLPHDGSGAQGSSRRNEALLLSEQAAHAHNTGQDTGPDLELFSPRESSAQLDYPYTLVDDDQLTAAQTRAANRFMTLLGGVEGQRALRERGFRAGNGEANEKITRAAGGRVPQPYSAGLDAPPSTKELQALLGKWTSTVQSARIATVVDASPSMANQIPGWGGRSRMELARNSLLKAVDMFTPDDEVGLWKFSTLLDGTKDYVELSPTTRLGDRGEDGGTHRDELTDAFSSLAPVPDGAAGLYDTTLAAYEQATKRYVNGKLNAVVIVTDGADDDLNSIGLDQLVDELQKAADPARPVPLIALAIGPEADQSALDRMVAPTGGSAHRVSDPSQIHEVILKAITKAGAAGPR
ncbi:substrate-binding and VWA domain-containing protein [Streptomyces sp. NPDC017993]|uniref:substrate-binding and VWA domain-containing protein n=1 Tax=Streptomyces sp. NPDC017993 TaxID=3365027 RepID=UPI0037BCC49C